jgi:hypothetical protein
MNERFYDVSGAVLFLKAAGYKISKGTFYNDRKRPGLLTSEKGKYTEKSLRCYAKRKPLQRVDLKPDEIQTNHLDLKNQLLKARVKEIEFKNRIKAGELVELNRVESEQAMKAAVLKTALLNHVRLSMPDIIRIVDGNLSNLDAAVEYWSDEIETFLHEFSRLDEIKVIIKKGTSDDDGNN